jgi:hypothetical protein
LYDGTNAIESDLDSMATGEFRTAAQCAQVRQRSVSLASVRRLLCGARRAAKRCVRRPTTLKNEMAFWARDAGLLHDSVRKKLVRGSEGTLTHTSFVRYRPNELGTAHEVCEPCL